jgi:hypothetical protein
MMFVWGTTVGTGIYGDLVECPFDDPETTGEIGERALSEALGAAWRSVAATGSTVEGTLAWPRFSVSNRETLVLTAPTPSQVANAGGKAADCAFWDALDFEAGGKSRVASGRSA